MVANVWRVAVEAGEQVAEGQTIVILESMKTEIPIPAPHDGVVREVSVAEGASIREGDVIAVIDGP
jgi:acetyl-CoA carboxylase biotin carboxyl carrier protein